MSIKDMIKKSVLAGFTASELTTTKIIVTLGLAIVLGLYIYFIYRLTVRSGFYSFSFNKSLATLPVITAGILLTMQSNLVITLGMVGALSIVRFRNAVKDTVDLTYLFWSISIGIVTGAGLFELAVLLCLCTTVVLVGLNLLPKLRQPYLLVIGGRPELEECVLLNCVQDFCSKCKVRSRSITQRGTEWILEVQVRDADSLMKAVCQLEGVLSSNLLSHEGEVRF